ncbi:MAG: HAD family hydrolase [Anaerovoracaceae bacterium]|jgi:Cof subfamily protein (haloacid dehalogenase superfamily)
MKKDLSDGIKLIALDIDGTTLKKGSILSDRTCGAIKAAMNCGIEVVYATGRMLDALPEDLMERTAVRYAITSNGANVVDVKKYESIYENTMTGKTIERVLEVVTEYNVLVEAFIKGSAYLDETWLPRLEGFGLPERHLKYALRTRRPIKNLYDFMTKTESGVECINLNFGDPSTKKAVYEKLSILEGISITSSFDHNWEIGAATANKADGLRALCEHINISRHNTMACGDNENDLEMIAFAALSVAVENAVDSVKQVADYIVSSNEDDGVAEAIERFALNGNCKDND